MSKSIRIKNVRINSSTVQTVVFKQFKDGSVLCKSKGFNSFWVALHSGKTYSARRPTNQLGEPCGKAPFVHARNPAKTFAKAVKAFWSV